MSNGYIERNSGNFIHEGEPRALYWHGYRATFEALKPKLVSGGIISSSLPLVILGNNSLQPQSFDLRKVDRMPIGLLQHPGKSCHIRFIGDPHEICGAIMDRDLKRQDRVYFLANQNEINKIGYWVFYCPLPNQPLHVRLVHEIHMRDSTVEQVPIKFRKLVADLFRKGKL